MLQCETTLASFSGVELVMLGSAGLQTVQAGADGGKCLPCVATADSRFGQP